MAFETPTSTYLLIAAGLRAARVAFARVPGDLTSENSEEFDNIEDLNDISDLTSLFGTPVFSNLQIPKGSYTDFDGNVIEYSGIRLDTVLFRVSQRKMIEKTSVQGRNGTVKEYISDGDFDIIINGAIAQETVDDENFIVESTGNKFPEQDMRTLIDIMKAPVQIPVISTFLSYFDIDDIVIESYDMPQEKGTRNLQFFTIRAVSDVPLEIQEIQNLTINA
jgi:hypothetical protein